MSLPDVTTAQEIFCPKCQLVIGLDCQCLYTLSSSSKKSKETVNGDSGDNGLSPDGRHLTSTDLPAGTPGTHQAAESPRSANHDNPGVPILGTNDLGVSPKPVRQTSWTAANLLAQEFAEPKWAVPGIVCEGLTLLAGAPKAGKSWLALGLALSVSTGGKALGQLDVEQGPALYLGLEDSPRRLQKRLRQQLAGAAAPDELIVAIESPPLPLGGIAKIDRHLAVCEDRDRPCRLVIIDVFAKVRGPSPQNMSAYDADYAAVAPLKQLADGYGCSIILVHHTRKVSSGDFMNEISGTLGLPGACDTVAVLKRSRGEADGLLQVTGRDVEEAEYGLRFDASLGAWQLLGLAADLDVSDTRRKILSWLRDHPGDKPTAIALGTGLNRELVKKTTQRMAAESQLDTDHQGRYFPPQPTAGIEEEADC